MRWPAIAGHLAARYREAACGTPADPALLLRPTDRRLLSSEHMAEQLLGWVPVIDGVGRLYSPVPSAGLPDHSSLTYMTTLHTNLPPWHRSKDAASWQPPPVIVKGSLAGYWRLAKWVVANARQKVELMMLCVPQQQVAQLKQLAAGARRGAAWLLIAGEGAERGCSEALVVENSTAGCLPLSSSPQRATQPSPPPTRCSQPAPCSSWQPMRGHCPCWCVLTRIGRVATSSRVCCMRIHWSIHRSCSGAFRCVPFAH
jgi:hypothetical protein